nr:CoA pyrophosphatase [Chromobacterium sp. ASV5]
MEAKIAAGLIADRLAAYDFTGRSGDIPLRMPTPDLRRAAVLMPLVWREEGPTVLLTRRNDNLSTHPGQVSFPGGKVDGDDESAIMAALREAREETGLDAARVSVLGTLPDYATITGYLVTPVVGLVTPPLALSPEPAEVAEVFEVPLPLLLDTSAYQRHDYERDGMRGQYLALDWRHYTIWGATAAMLWLLADALKPWVWHQGES